MDGARNEARIGHSAGSGATSSTVSEEEENYDDKIMIDHSADEITTEEAAEL